MSWHCSMDLIIDSQILGPEGAIIAISTSGFSLKINFIISQSDSCVKSDEIYWNWSIHYRKLLLLFFERSGNGIVSMVIPPS